MSHMDYKKILLTDSNEIVLFDNAYDLLREDFKIAIDDVVVQSSFVPIMTRGLFDTEPRVIWLQLHNKKSRKEFVDSFRLKANREKTIADLDRQPILITINEATGYAAIKKHIKDLIVIENSKQIPEDLLDGIPLSLSTRNEVLNYVGESSEKLIPFLNTIRNWSDKKIKALEPLEALMMFDSNPGKIPPYKFLEPAFTGQPQKAVEEYLRMRENHPFLIALIMLKNRVGLIYRGAVLYEENKNINEVIKMMSDRAAWSLKKYMPFVSSREKMEKIVSKVFQLEELVKGGGYLNIDDSFCKLLVEIDLIKRTGDGTWYR